MRYVVGPIPGKAFSDRRAVIDTQSGKVAERSYVSSPTTRVLLTYESAVHAQRMADRLNSGEVRAL